MTAKPTIDPDPAATADVEGPGVGPAGADTVVLDAGAGPVDWQVILDSIDDSICVIDKHDRLLAWNRQYAKSAGPLGERFRRGMHHLDVLELFARHGRYGPGDPKALAAERMRSIRVARRHYQEEVERLDGRFDAVRRMELGDGAYVAIRSSIDDRKRIESDLEETSALVKATFDALEQPICVWDGNQRLVAWNEKYVAMEGLRPEDLQPNMHLKALLMHTAMKGFLGEGDLETLVEKRHREIIGDEVSTRDEITRAGGRIYDVNRAPLPSGGIFAVFNDVTDRERATEALRQAKAEAERANAVKSDFLANMSHELRTPLNAIIGFAELMMYGKAVEDSVERYRGYAGNIRDSAVILLDIINDLLDLAKIESGRMKLAIGDVDVRGAIDTTLELARRTEGAANLTIENLVPADFPLVATDALALRQIMINLLSNAVKATPDGGRITVDAAVEDDAVVGITVTDTGIGMPANILESVFDPYRSTGGTYVRKVKSTGLGLSIVKRLVELLNGDVEIESEPDRGTRVRVRLPRAWADD